MKVLRIQSYGLKRLEITSDTELVIDGESHMKMGMLCKESAYPFQFL
ncbi:hypothetical protein N6H13_00580 [Paenibacillus sp. CC-CFT742]|nr:hypothetical protein [Paenibacillus sp. CC-CFT742]WJH29339.1 hypothetical protein N6H13_00580 [Paenibacillus sp. CC-CFT742]